MACYIVGNLDLTSTADLLTSIEVSSNTEVNKTGEELLIGPTIGNVSISGYASREIAYSETGGGNASVSINYVQKYDCDNDIVYLLFAGAGKSKISGDIGGLANVVEPVPFTYDSISASITNGPAQPYMSSTQQDGYGLDYSGGPIPFATSSDSVFSIEVKGSGAGGQFNLGRLYLKSFNLTYNPGTIPTASYTFIYTPEGSSELIVLPDSKL